jgi:hypothetical protein
LVAIVLLALWPLTADAHGYKRKGIEVVHPWTLETKGPGALVHLTIRNSGKSADRLLGVATEDAAAARVAGAGTEAGGILVPAGGSAVIGEAGPRIELEGLKRPLSAYDRVPLKLMFERAGSLSIEVVVEQAEEDTAVEPAPEAR